MTPGNVHDSYVLQPLVEKIIKKVKKPLAIATDTAYKTPAITNFLLENQMLLFSLIHVLKQRMVSFESMNMCTMSTIIVIFAHKGRY